MSLDKDLNLWWEENYNIISSVKPSHSRRFKFAEDLFVVDFHQPEDAFFTNAIAHNEIFSIDTSNTDFKIHVIDASISKINLSGWFIESHLFKFNGQHYLSTNDNNIILHVYHPDNGFIIQLINKLTSHAIIWYSEFGIIPEWEQSFPFRQVLHHYYESTDYCLIHGAGVGINNSGVLITAKGGSGKSTSALACITNGWNYIGDDFILVNHKTMIMYSLYNVAKLEPKQLGLFPNLNELMTNKIDTLQKRQLFLFPRYKAQLPKQLKIKAIILPNYNPKATNSYLTPDTASNALLKMAPSTILLVKGDKTLFTKLVNLCKKTEIYKLDTSSNLETIVNTLKSII